MAKKLDDEKILSIVREHMDGAWSSSTGSWWVTEAQKASDRYFRRPKGNEKLGMSEFLSSDVHDVVESSMPGMLEVFASTDDAVLFEAAPADPQKYEINAQQAKEANAAVRRVLWHDNPGMLIQHAWIHDAHLKKNGVVTWWCEEIEEVDEETLQGLQLEQVVQMQEAGEEIIAYTENIQQVLDPMTQQPVSVPVIDITVRKTKKKKVICIANVPPHEFIPDPRARSTRPADMDFCAQVTRKSVSDLRMAGLIGLDEDLEDDGDGPPEDFRNRWAQMSQDAYDSSDDANTNDESMRQVWVHNAFLKIDADGDGIAELRNIKYVGNRILENQVVDHIPFSAYTPVPQPHQFNGMSLAEQVFDVEDLKTELIRQTLNAMYMANEPRLLVNRNSGLDLDDLLTVRPNGLVRANTTVDAAVPLVSPNPAISQAFPMIEYADAMREIRTGLTRYNQGLDSKSLNKTASGISQIFNASQQRERLRARLFAEVGLKDLYWGIVKTLKKYTEEPIAAKIGDQVTMIDPRKWSMQYDITINVGIGSGNKDQMLAHLMSVTQDQIAAIQMGGLNKIVTLENIYHTQLKKLENMGIKNGTEHWTDPSTAQPEQPKPDPEIEKAKMQQDTEIKKAGIHQQTEITKKQMELQQRTMYGPYSGMPQ